MLELHFAGKAFQVTFVNLGGKDYGQYQVAKARLTAPDSPSMRLPVIERQVVLDRALLAELPAEGNQIAVELI